ncbi:MAG: hypothetical protein RLZZ216_1018 [Cyanobacteriota bacterium]
MKLATSSSPLLQTDQHRVRMVAVEHHHRAVAGVTQGIHLPARRSAPVLDASTEQDAAAPAPWQAAGRR